MYFCNCVRVNVWEDGKREGSGSGDADGSGELCTCMSCMSCCVCALVSMYSLRVPTCAYMCGCMAGERGGLAVERKGPDRGMAHQGGGIGRGQQGRAWAWEAGSAGQGGGKEAPGMPAGA